MPQRPTVTYAPRHAAISAMIEVVATPPIARFVKGEIRTLRPEDKFVLEALKPQRRYPNPTEWVVTGNAEFVNRITADLKAEFMAIWGDTDWLFAGDQLVWVPAVPASTADQELLVDAYCAEVGADPETARQELISRWLSLRRRLR